MRKAININTNTTVVPFAVSVNYDTKTGRKLIYTVEKRSIIYKSFNLKDIMVDESFIDKDTATLIKEKEKNLDRHVIHDLSKEQELYKDSIIYLSLHISSNLNVTYAEVLSGPIRAGEFTKDDEPPWDEFPEMISFSPPLEFDEKGQLKNSSVTRIQQKAYVPIAYVTSDPAAVGKTITFPTQAEEKAANQTLVQVLDTNLIMQTFNYDGIPVAYPIPFFGGTYLYYDFSKNK